MTAKKQATPQIEAPAVHTQSKGKFVTVASKMPMSIQLQLCKARTGRVTGQFGSVEETVNVPTGEIHVIRGTSYPRGEPPEGYPDKPNMIRDANGGYALTPKVPADFWTEWVKQNAETEMVRNGMIKAQSDLDDLASDAAEHASVSSGLGPLNPKGDVRNPRPANSMVAQIKPEARVPA